MEIGKRPARAARVRALAASIAVAVLAEAGCRSAPPPDGPNLILISVDTLRADHVGVYGYHRALTPNIDRLAREGILFENAIANAPWTSPSHASMLTGLYPGSHGLSHTGRRLSTGARTLAEALSGSGFATGGFTGGVTLASEYGFGRGFDVYDDRSGVYFEGILPKALDWLAARRKGRFFMFLHSFDAHYPYRRHPEIVATFPGASPAVGPPYSVADLDRLAAKLDAGTPLSESESRTLLAVVLFPKEMKEFREKIQPRIFRALDRLRRREPLDPVDTAVLIAGRPYKPDQAAQFARAIGTEVSEEAFYRLVAEIVPLLGDPRYRQEWLKRISDSQRDAYDANIVVADRAIGELLESLERQGRLANTWIVFTSDHGESFLDHLPSDHETVLYEELVHVPLIIRPPGGVAPRRIRPVVELTDLYPSILEVLGAPRATGPIQGRSLAAVWRGGDLEPSDPTAGPASARLETGSPRPAPAGLPAPASSDAVANGLAYSEYMDLTASLRSDRFMLMRTLPSGRDELYDLAADPMELTNLAATHTFLTETLRETLVAQRKRNAEIGARLGVETLAPSEELQEKLRSLGYVH